MNPQLRIDARQLSQILEQTLQVVTRQLARQGTASPGIEVPAIPARPLPVEGAGAEAVLRLFETEYAHQFANSAGPRYWGFVTGGTTPAALAADWLVTVLDQVVGEAHGSIAPQLELQTIDLLKQLLGLDPQYSGTFVTGATMASFVGLAQARQWAGLRQGINAGVEGVAALKPIKVLSGTPHSSIEKALSMLGLGRNTLVRMETLPNREAVDLQFLENYLVNHPDETIIITGNAGTVNTVDFDDLEGLGRLKEKYGCWLHVDAAFGGFAACSPQFSHWVRGINYADSITVDAHKWLNVPYDAAMQFTRHPRLQAQVFYNQSAYLGDPEAEFNFIHYTPENSRRFRALPVWFSLMAYGSEGYRELVERNGRVARLLGEKLTASGKFRVLAPVHMNVVCFTFKDETVDAALIGRFLADLRDDGRVFMTPTVYKGILAIRAAISNWQTTEEDLSIAFQALLEVYDRKYIGAL